MRRQREEELLMLANYKQAFTLSTMIDRDEFLRFRIDNYLDKKHARVKKVQTALGSTMLRQAAQAGTTVGAFADSRRAFKHDDRHYFIETPIEGSDQRRQLWLPALQWVTFGTLRRREIIATQEQPDRRFAAWQDAQVLVDQVEGYSAYDPQNQALFEEAKLILQFMGANDDQFDFSVEER